MGVARRLGKPDSYVSRCESGEHAVEVFELLEFVRLYRRGLRFFVRSGDENDPIPAE